MTDSADPLELSHCRPDWSACVPLTRGQRGTLIVLAGAVIVASALAPLAAARAAVLFCTLFYLGVTFYKLVLVRASEHAGAMLRFDAAALAARDARPWPLYSILVPMYREPETLPLMVQALQALDYPAECKDVQLLLEADDEPTLAAARRLDLPPYFRITIIPPSFPRTKPKACNIGLHHARGEYLVIYDAEDRPDPDQLRNCLLYTSDAADE